MRIALLAAVWRRVELAPAWWAGIDRMRAQCEEAGHELVPYIAGSEKPHRALCEAHGGVWVEAPNRPLGAKWNACYAASEGDYIFVTGSDDWYSPPLVDLYLDQLDLGYEYVGLEGIYFHELATGRVCHWGGYRGGHHRKGEPIGAGRLVARHLVTRPPWDDDLQSGLDYSMTNRLGLQDCLLLPMGPGAPAVDVKTRANIWRYEHVEPFAVTDSEEIMHALPEWHLIRAARYGMPETVAREVTPDGRLRVFVSVSTVTENRRNGTDLPAIVVRYPDSREEQVHEVQGQGWTVRSKAHGHSPHVWLETRETVTLVRRGDAA